MIDLEKITASNMLTLTDRERDTIIAALRLWQESLSYGARCDIMEIADNDREGADAHLSAAEIDELIEERINS